MAIELNHTIVHASDNKVSATFLADLFDRGEPTPYGPFLQVKLDNQVELDFMTVDRVHQQHYAFLVSDEEFDAILGRIQDRGLPYWADPSHTKPQEINQGDGGRGVYWDDPDGHILEIITVPYGGWPS
ncbi:MAG TPA: VOC family protein [Nocardioidaceae bacterium]|nr:VOC family protein [Nocardioidaceae bacterium]